MGACTADADIIRPCCMGAHANRRVSRRSSTRRAAVRAAHSSSEARQPSEAGQWRLGPSDANGDQPLIRQVGKEGFTDANIAALCAALK